MPDGSTMISMSGSVVAAWPVSTSVREAIKVATKIRSFAQLPVGWHYGEGRPISAKVISRALEYSDFLAIQGLGAEAFASERGSITLLVNINGKYTEIRVETGRTYTIVRDGESSGVIFLRGLSLMEAQKATSQMMGNSWSTSAGSTLVNIPAKREGSSVMHFAISGTLHAGDSLLVECECVAASGTSICEHARTYYSNTVGDKVIFWKFNSRDLPDSANIVKKTSKSGDKCHVNVYNISDKELYDFFFYSDSANGAARDISEFTICTEDGTRALTPADLPDDN